VSSSFSIAHFVDVRQARSWAGSERVHCIGEVFAQPVRWFYAEKPSHLR